jgi:Domain of unknown function (DUF4831)
MKQITILGLSAILIALSFGVSAKDDKKKGAGELGAFPGGVIYSLPRTGIRIFTEATQEKFFHGPYYEYAQKYLGIKNVSTTDGEFWKITDLKFETFGAPDPSEVHKANGAVASMLSLSDDGVLLGINCSVKADNVKTYSTVFTPSVELPKEIWNELSMHSFLAEKDSTKHAGDKVKSFEEKAAEAAMDILKLRKRKALILASKYDKLPPDGKAYQVMVDELSKIIGDYESLFVGKSFKATHNYVFEVIPDAKSNKPLVAFRFSPSSGVLPETNVSGKPIMLELDPNLDLSRNSEQKIAASPGETSTNGLVYRTPGSVVARLLNGSDVLAQAHLAMAQFGAVAPFPDGLITGEYVIELHPVTGAIRRVGN